ncbi:MAG: hypothetical protein ACI4XA_09880 [Oscillospiraceae bacterium]
MDLKWDMGEGWRSAFKRSMWISVVVFEVVSILLSIQISDLLAAFNPSYRESKAVFIVLGIIFGTIINEMFHALWGCIAYMFDDLARSRAANERIAELLEIQEKRISEKEAENAPKDTYIGVSRQSKEKGRILSVSERIARNEKEGSAPAGWNCPECGRLNPITAAMCKDCGHYK